MSRIYYEGKYYDYPIKASNALRNLGLVGGVRCVVSYAVGARPPAEGPDHARGLDRGRFGWRLYRHFFKTYNEKLWGVPAQQDPGRLRRAAHQEPVVRATRCVNRADAEAATRRTITSPHRGVPVPEVRARA